MKWKAIIDRGFSYVTEDRPIQGNEVLPRIIASNLEPRNATLIAAAPELLAMLQVVECKCPISIPNEDTRLVEISLPVSAVETIRTILKSATLQ